MPLGSILIGNSDSATALGMDPKGRKAMKYPDGYAAYGSKEERLGRVESVIAIDELRQPLYLVIDTWSLLRGGRNTVVPFGEVTSIDDQDRRVNLEGLTKAILESDIFPAADERWWDKNRFQQFSEAERATARVYQEKSLVHSQ